MNILIVANHFPVCSARFAADAFTRLGHTVRHVGQPMGRSIWGGQVPEEYVWTPDIIGMRGLANEKTYASHGADIVPIALDDLPARLFDADPFFADICIVMDSDPAVLDWAEAGAQLNTKGVSSTVVWGVDNHVRDYRRPHFDHYFLAHKSVSAMPWEVVLTSRYIVPGETTPFASYVNADMTWLPCAFDPAVFTPSSIPWEQRQYDVCMIGVMYPKRWELVQAMRAAGLKVLAGTGLVYDAYRDAYHNSRVALVSSACGDLPIRLFEGAGMGCAVLCDEIADLKLLAPKSSPVMTYSSAADAIAQVKALCVMSLENAGIAVGYSVDWAQQHTFDKRAQVIIDWALGVTLEEFANMEDDEEQS